ncbi:MAG: hypothetical protein JNG90_09515 [Planctomycetaceae bacterium]|nr:hypothetical protein [Planctomycetaceae bacterium]
MAKGKKKSAKKAGSKAADGEIVILLPDEAWKDYQSILRDPELGQDTIDSIVKSVLGSQAKFNINSVKFDEKGRFAESANVNQIPRKC